MIENKELIVSVMKALVTALCISFAATPFVRRLAFTLGAVDVPRDNRRMHNHPIPRMGGLAIFFGFILSALIFVPLDAPLRGMLLGAVIIVILGIFDDIYALPALPKLLVQIAAASVAVLMGNQIEVLSNPNIFRSNPYWDLGFLSIPISVFWIVGITNAVNLIDGLDGLCGGISVIILTVIAMLAVIEGRSDVEMIALILVGATLGFLIYNAHPASIFMGDCGALFLGFIISAISLLGFKSSTIMTLALPLLLLALPIIDTLSAILRRTLKGHKFSEADKSHIHHLLMNKFGHKNTVIIMCIVTALFGLTAYIYMINKGIGLISLFVIMLAVDLFIEGSGMISDKYHPILSVSRRIIRRLTRKKTITDSDRTD